MNKISMERMKPFHAKSNSSWKCSVNGHTYFVIVMAHLCPVHSRACCLIYFIWILFNLTNNLKNQLRVDLKSKSNTDAEIICRSITSDYCQDIWIAVEIMVFDHPICLSISFSNEIHTRRIH